MVKVYVVTSGDYSDYHINAVWSTQRKAEKFRKDYGYDEVEEYELDQDIIRYPITTISMEKDGNVQTTTLSSGPQLRGYKNEGFWFYSMNRGDISTAVLNWRVNTDDKERAIKVVNEKRIQILANDYWGDDERTKELFNQT